MEYAEKIRAPIEETHHRHRPPVHWCSLCQRAIRMQIIKRERLAKLPPPWASPKEIPAK